MIDEVNRYVDLKMILQKKAKKWQIQCFNILSVYIYLASLSPGVSDCLQS